MDPQYGWHTVAWVATAIIFAVAFFRLGGFGMDQHENLPMEETPMAVGCVNWLARMICGLAIALSAQCALFGWPFLGWSMRV